MNNNIIITLLEEHESYGCFLFFTMFNSNYIYLIFINMPLLFRSHLDIYALVSYFHN